MYTFVFKDEFSSVDCYSWIFRGDWDSSITNEEFLQIGFNPILFSQGFASNFHQRKFTQVQMGKELLADYAGDSIIWVSWAWQS